MVATEVSADVGAACLHRCMGYKMEFVGCAFLEGADKCELLLDTEFLFGRSLIKTGKNITETTTTTALLIFLHKGQIIWRVNG